MKTNLTSVVGVIPARYQSSRFPGKPLAKIAGRPMIEWVYKNARKSLKRVIVATDDKRIFNVVKGFGGDVMMTPKSCQTGTDRVYVVSQKVRARYVVNIQGDEPVLPPRIIAKTVQVAQIHKSMATAAVPLRPSEQRDENSVKVVVDAESRALYFSRSLIPFPRAGITNSSLLMKHLGLYVYPSNVLAQFVKWPRPRLEKTEQLEQLRALFYGIPLYVAVSQGDSIGVDTRSDVKKVERILKLRRF